MDRVKRRKLLAVRRYPGRRKLLAVLRRYPGGIEKLAEDTGYARSVLYKFTEGGHKRIPTGIPADVCKAFEALPEHDQVEPGVTIDELVGLWSDARGEWLQAQLRAFRYAEGAE